MKRLCTNACEPELKVQKIESVQLMSLSDDLLGLIIRCIFQQYQFDATELRCLCHRMIKIIEDQPENQLRCLVKKTVLAMRRIKTFDCHAGHLAYAYLLLYSPSRESRAYDAFPIFMQNLSINDHFRREIISKEINAGNLGAAKYYCKNGDLDLSLKIDYIRNKKANKQTSKDFFYKTICSARLEDIDCYWQIMGQLDAEAAFSVFESIDDEKLFGNCLPASLLSYGLEKSYKRCRSLENKNHLKRYLREMSKIITAENYLNFLHDINLEPSEFTALANEYCNDHDFYKFASLFVKACDQAQEVVWVAHRILSQNIWHACYLYAEMGLLAYFTKKILADPSIVLGDIDRNFLIVFQTFYDGVDDKTHVQNLYDIGHLKGIEAVMPCLSKRGELPVDYMVNHVDLVFTNWLRGGISTEFLIKSLKGVNVKAFLCVTAFNDMEEALRLLESGEVKLYDYKMKYEEHSRASEEWSSAYYQLMGILLIADCFMEYHFVNDKKSVRKIGETILYNPSLLILVEKESLLKSDILEVFKWCDSHLTGSSFVVQFIKKIELIAEKTDDPELHLWIFQEIRLLLL